MAQIYGDTTRVGGYVGGVDADRGPIKNNAYRRALMEENYKSPIAVKITLEQFKKLGLEQVARDYRLTAGDGLARKAFYMLGDGATVWKRERNTLPLYTVVQCLDGITLITDYQHKMLALFDRSFQYYDGLTFAADLADRGGV